MEGFKDMKGKVLIKATIERTMVISEEKWKNDYGEHPPDDMEDVAMIQDEGALSYDELTDVEIKEHSRRKDQ